MPASVVRHMGRWFSADDGGLAGVHPCLMQERLRCRHCHDVIGVYEPIVIHAEGEWREASLLSEQVEPPLGECYHRACFDETRARLVSRPG
jgi:hypothetical protein